MAIARSQLLKELEPGLNALFGLEYAQYPEEWKAVFASNSSNKAFEEDVLLEGFGSAPVKNEGSAISLGIGYYLATKKIPCVYLQNSGLGNAINPLISIVHKKVYSIPMLLIIGWRGAPKSNDEPQHMIKGKITRNLLKLLNIKFMILNNKKDLKKLEKLILFSSQNKVPVACLIKKDSFINSKTKTLEKFKKNSR